MVFPSTQDSQAAPSSLSCEGFFGVDDMVDLQKMQKEWDPTQVYGDFNKPI